MSSPKKTEAPEQNPQDDLNVLIGRRVHQRMWDRHITQVEYGDRAGMDQSSVAKRLRGKLGWNAVQVKQAAEILNTTVAYLYGESESPERPNGPVSVEPPISGVKQRRLATVTPIRVRVAS